MTDRKTSWSVEPHTPGLKPVRVDGSQFDASAANLAVLYEIDSRNEQVGAVELVSPETVRRRRSKCSFSERFRPAPRGARSAPHRSHEVPLRSGRSSGTCPRSIWIGSAQTQDTLRAPLTSVLQTDQHLRRERRASPRGSLLLELPDPWLRILTSEHGLGQPICWALRTGVATKLPPAGRESASHPCRRAPYRKSPANFFALGASVMHAPFDDLVVVLFETKLLGGPLRVSAPAGGHRFRPP